MSMSKTRKIWLGIFTFLPMLFLIAYFIFFFAFLFSTFQNAENYDAAFPAAFMSSFAILFTLIMLSGLLSIGLLIYYIVHANNNSENDSNKKLMWTLVLIFTSGIGSIVYYFVEILPLKPMKDKEKTSRANDLTAL